MNKEQMSQEQLQEFIKLAQEQQRREYVERIQAVQRATEHQQVIDEEPRRKYAVIVAVDAQGGFSKDGAIPWHFSEDLKWFKGRTKTHICLMGHKTYENINSRLDGKNAESVLPDRRCFVFTTTLKELPNATVVKSIGEIENHLTDDDVDKTIFIIGGERLFREGIALADTVYVTVVNGEYSCDKFFPTDHLMERFSVSNVYKHENSPELRFTIWKRKS